MIRYHLTEKTWTVRHGFRFAEDLDESFQFPQKSGLSHYLRVVNLLVGDNNVLCLILTALRGTDHKHLASSYHERWGRYLLPRDYSTCFPEGSAAIEEP